VQLIEALSVALNHVLVFGTLAMYTEQANLFGDALIVGDNHASVPVRSEVLCREEAEAGREAEAAHRSRGIPGTMRLCRVLDDN